MADKIYDIGSGKTYANITAARDAIVSEGITADDYYLQIYGAITDYVGIGNPLGFGAANHVYIEAAPGEEHNGTPGTGASVSNSTVAQFVIKLDGCTNITVRNLEIYETGSNGIGLSCVNSAAGIAHACIISAPNGLYNFAASSSITSCLIFDCTVAGFLDHVGSKAVTFENNTIKDCFVGIDSVTGCYFNGGHNVWYNCTTDNSGSQVWNDGYNASTTGSPVGPNPISTALDSGDFVNVASDNMNVYDTYSTVYHAGTAGGGLYDIVGTIFDSTTRSIGCFEYISPITERSLSDNVVVYGDKRYLKNLLLQDIANIEDFSIIGEIESFVTIIDSISIYDSILSSGVVTLRGLTEYIATYDSTSKSLNSIRNLLDNVLATDWAYKFLFKALTDEEVYIDDSAKSIVTMLRLASDLVDAGDEMVRTIKSSRTFTDTTFAVDNILKAVRNFRKANDAINVIDDFDGFMTTLKTINDNVDVYDFTSRFVTAMKSITDVVSVEERVTRALELERALNEEVDAIDGLSSSASAVLSAYVYIIVNMR